jgi:hypothetical protein
MAQCLDILYIFHHIEKCLKTICVPERNPYAQSDTLFLCACLYDAPISQNELINLCFSFM